MSDDTNIYREAPIYEDLYGRVRLDGAELSVARSWEEVEQLFDREVRRLKLDLREHLARIRPELRTA